MASAAKAGGDIAQMATVPIANTSSVFSIARFLQSRYGTTPAASVAIRCDVGVEPLHLLPMLLDECAVVDRSRLRRLLDVRSIHDRAVPFRGLALLHAHLLPGVLRMVRGQGACGCCRRWGSRAIGALRAERALDVRDPRPDVRVVGRVARRLAQQGHMGVDQLTASRSQGAIVLGADDLLE